MIIARTCAAFAVMIAATAGNAATVADSPQPAEFPPASYKGAQYVDSRGCVFIRADLSGTVNWVPRVKRSREQLCGFQPTKVAGATASAPRKRQTSAPEIIIPDTLPNGQPVAAAATALATPVATATARSASVAAPVQVPAAQIAPAPVQIQPVAPVVSPSVVEPAAPRRVTLTEACSGRHGVQSGIVSARTGQPVDCGPAPAAARTVAVQPLQQRRVGNGTACLGQVKNGTFSVSGSVRCAPQPERPYDVAPARSTPVTTQRTVAAPVVKAPAPARPAIKQAPQPTYQSGALSCLQAIQQGRFSITTADGQTHRCAPQAQTPYDRSSDASAAPTVVVPDRRGAPARATVVQTSRPRLFGAKRASGMRSVWNDNRMNPARGITVLRLPG